MPFSTLVMKYLQYAAALTQPSVSTHNMRHVLAGGVGGLDAFAEPRPDAAGDREDDVAPSVMKVLAMAGPRRGW